MGKKKKVEKVLVTGATGFIGRACLKALKQKKYEIHAISRKRVEQQDLIQWHCLDLMDTEQVEGIVADLKPDLLLHLAWYTKHQDFWNAKENIQWLKLSKKLFSSFYKHGGRRIVSSGTCAEYEWTSEYYHENNSACLSRFVYGNTKNKLYQYLNTLRREQNTSYAWARIFHAYGPHENEERFIPYVIRSLLNNENALCTLGKQKRDLIYIDDVASALVALLKSKYEGAVNIGSGVPHTLSHVATKIAEKIGCEQMVKQGAIAEREGEPVCLLPTLTCLHETVGWKSKLSLDEGLDKSIDWHRKNL